MTNSCTVPRDKWKCPNCGDSHRATFHGCRKWKEAKAAVKISVSENIPRATALVKVRNGATYAAAGRGNTTTSRSEDPNHPPLLAPKQHQQTPTIPIAVESLKERAAVALEKYRGENTTKEKKKKKEKSSTERKLEAIMGLMARFMEILVANSHNDEFIQLAKSASEILLETDTDSSDNEEDKATASGNTAPAKKKKKKIEKNKGTIATTINRGPVVRDRRSDNGGTSDNGGGDDTPHTTTAMVTSQCRNNTPPQTPLPPHVKCVLHCSRRG